MTSEPLPNSWAEWSTDPEEWVRAYSRIWTWPDPNYSGWQREAAAMLARYAEARDAALREALVERVGDAIGRQAAIDVVDASFAAIKETP